MSDEILYQQVYELTKIIEEMQRRQDKLIEEVGRLNYIVKGPSDSIKAQAMDKIVEQLRKGKTPWERKI